MKNSLMRNMGFLGRQNEQNPTINDMPALRARIIREIESGHYQSAGSLCHAGLDEFKIRASAGPLSEAEMTAFREIEQLVLQMQEALERSNSKCVIS